MKASLYRLIVHLVPISLPSQQSQSQSRVTTKIVYAKNVPSFATTFGHSCCHFTLLFRMLFSQERTAALR